ncbi:hydrocephalus-inducing protein-like, partial [Limulus polyphemus]|uniref:Hydrocephalus-inducing protein-like n=1 Tax=Limulus polyphemus TaxID=6850 RepID=A0ABM1TD41_LIMPO
MAAPLGEVKVGHLVADYVSIYGKVVVPLVVLDLQREREPSIHQERCMQHQDWWQKDLEVLIEHQKIKMSEKNINEEVNLQHRSSCDLNFSQKLWKDVALSDYVLDLGYVLAGSLQQKEISVMNFGTVTANLQLTGTTWNTAQIYIEPEDIQVEPGSTKFILKLFSDLGTNFLGEQKIPLFLQVIGGPVLTINMRAFVTLPAVTVNPFQLDFGPLYCGLCEVKWLFLKNPGPIKCEWSSEVISVLGIKKPKNILVPHYGDSDHINKPSGSVFDVKPKTGCLHPEEWCYLQVMFTPTSQTHYKNKLQLTVYSNPNVQHVILQGSGIQPKLSITPERLDFGQTLPRASLKTIEVKIYNPGVFPLEFSCVEFDYTLVEEKKVGRKKTIEMKI